MSSTMPMWWAEEDANGERCTTKLATSQHPDGPEIPEPFCEYQKEKYDPDTVTSFRSKTSHSLHIIRCTGRPTCCINQRKKEDDFLFSDDFQLLILHCRNDN